MPPRLGVNLAFLVKRERAGWIYLDEDTYRARIEAPRGGEVHTVKAMLT